MKRLILILAFALAFVAAPSGQSDQWPLPWLPPDSKAAIWMIDVVKTTGNEMINETPDPAWAHLHAGHAPTVGLAVRIGSWFTLPQDKGGKALADFTDLQIRYTVRGAPVSPWLSTPFTWTLPIDNPALPALDGIHDIAVDVQATRRQDYTYRPIYLHLSRGRAVASTVPVISQSHIYADYGIHEGSVGYYVDLTQARAVPRPVDPAVTPWHTPTTSTPDLYQEEMAPHTNLFHSQVFIWEEPSSSPNAGLPFVRALPAKFDEDHRGLRVTWGHEKLPYLDGPRGIGWTSPYVTGQVAPDGRFIFKEPGGRIGEMAPDGTIRTIAGWRVKPGKRPIWIAKPLEEVRQNMERVGTWVNGAYPNGDGFRTPLDVAIDPKDPRIYYVAGFEDQAIWRIDDRVTPALVSVFVGDVNHSKGFVDGTGTAARFNGPTSVVFDPVCDCLYVADQDNDAVRRVSREGVVTTLLGAPGQAARQIARGVTTTDQYQIQRLNREAAGAHYARGANDATTLETYLPHTVRVDSLGNLILLDIGFGAIRRIHPGTLEATHLAAVTQRFESNTGTSSRGWAWLDVDRWGNAGPKDGIYYGAAQASWCDGETEQRTNEAWCYLAPGTTGGKFPFRDWDPYPDGWGPREKTDPPHYMWGVAVDPRGAILMAGMGEHGITRMRVRKPGDPVVTNDAQYMRAKDLWLYGWQPGAVTPTLRFGSEGHMTLVGIAPDAGDYADASDAAITAAFGFETATPDDRAALISFVRLNGAAWRPAGQTPPAPTPVDCRVSDWGTWSIWVPVSPTREQRTRSRTVFTPAANGGRPCPALTETEARDVPPAPVLTLTLTSVAKTCTVTLAADPPDTTGGWTAQFREGTTTFGAKVTKAPYARTKDLPATATAFSVTWTKAGREPMTASAVHVAKRCQ